MFFCIFPVEFSKQTGDILLESFEKKYIKKNQNSTKYTKKNKDHLSIKTPLIDTELKKLNIIKKT